MSYANPRIPASEIGRMGRLVTNWDGHGGEAVPQAASDNALHFLHRADDKFGSIIPRPTVGALGPSLGTRVPTELQPGPDGATLATRPACPRWPGPLAPWTHGC